MFVEKAHGRSAPWRDANGNDYYGLRFIGGEGGGHFHFRRHDMVRGLESYQQGWQKTLTNGFCQLFAQMGLRDDVDDLTPGAYHENTLVALRFFRRSVDHAPASAPDDRTLLAWWDAARNTLLIDSDAKCGYPPLLYVSRSLSLSLRARLARSGHRHERRPSRRAARAGDTGGSHRRPERTRGRRGNGRVSFEGTSSAISTIC